MTRFQPLRFSASALALAAIATFSVGCDSGTTQPDPTPPAQPDGDGHNHGDGDDHAIAPLTIAGRTITLSVGGEIEPGAESHIDVAIEGEPVETIYLWIGNEDDANPLKVNLGSTGGHAHAEAPADLDGAHIVVELKIDGELITGAAELPHHEEGEGHDDDGEGHGEGEEGEGHDHDGEDADHEHGEGEDHDHDGDGVPDH